MIFTETPLAGAYLLGQERRVDDRGFFARTFCTRELEAHGLAPHVAQANVSSNRARGTVRGMHFQKDPHGETKIVRVTRGSIFDVIVDLRPTSATRGRWFGVELTAAEGTALYVPVGFAHGFQTLEDDVEVLYLMGALYEPSAASGVRFDDPALGITWPLPPVAVSPADRALPSLAEASLR